MKNINVLAAVLMFAGFACVHAKTVEDETDPVAVVSELTIAWPKQWLVPYQGKTFASRFAGGLVPGIFSGASYLGDGHIIAMSDRGPNVKAPWIRWQGQNRPSKVFASKDYGPTLYRLRVDGDKLIAEEKIDLKDENGRPINGLPTAVSGAADGLLELALEDDARTLIELDNRGADFEGVVWDSKRESYWACGEYGPELVQIDTSGQIQKRYTPETGLAEILRHRIPNRGFEGIALQKETGQLLLSMQSVLDVEGRTKKSAPFIRFVVFDPAQGRQTKSFAYPIDSSFWGSSDAVKIGDITLVDDYHGVAIEQGKDGNGRYQNMISLFDLSDATNLDALSSSSSLEQLSPSELKAKELKMIRRTVLFDAGAHGWSDGEVERKMESVIILGPRTLAFGPDTDFGIRGVMKNGPLPEPEKYLMDVGGKSLRLRETSEATPNAQFVLEATTTLPSLWVVRLRQDLKRYFQ